MSEVRPLPSKPTARRWWILVILLLAQLTDIMVVTIVNIALPSAQADLGFTDVERQWVITAYALAFGALLLVGGRLADRFGAKRMLIIGLVGFGIASAVAGFAGNFSTLAVARTAQGAFGALIAPSVLALINQLFTEPDARRRAFALYGGITAAGAAIGLILGGVFTEYLSWRWGMFVNIPIVVVVLVAATLIRIPSIRQDARLNIPSALLVAAGLGSVVYGFERAAEHGWDNPFAIAALAAGAVLLLGFVLLQKRLRHPLLPLRIPGDRTRGAALIMVGLSTIAMFSVFFFLVYFLQGVLAFTPLQSGMAFIPLLLGIAIGAGISSLKLFSRVPPGVFFLTAGIIGAGGLLMLTQLTADSTYAAGILPALIITGIGVGAANAKATNLATAGVRPEDTGVASAFLNSMQQIGGSLGIAILNTVAVQATARYLDQHPAVDPAGAINADINGYTTAFLVSALIIAGTGALTAALIPWRTNNESHGRPAWPGSRTSPGGDPGVASPSGLPSRDRDPSPGVPFT